jgi:ATP-dependent Clp protease ATP-binding subunit ClpC
VNVAPASKDETIAVMQDQLIVYEFNRKVLYTYQSLEEAYRLSERYVHELAMPGRALKLLESAAGYTENGLVTMNSVQSAIEKTMDVKVSTASDGAEREKLLNLEQLIHERMINQSRAVQVVSDALRRARAGVRNQNRPIGTFLFLGPTGVGKTELAKALADVYFNGENNIIRLDMNEYVRNEDVARLIADGADDPTSLTAQAMKKPFSVVLLDEIEKAHPNVLTTLLQLLDEGILRDIKNREVSFRDAIIIATSNAGAERIREYIDRGYKLEQFEEELTNELISSNQFRPEFLNRFDEIVVFRPLEKPELVQVIDLMIKGVNKTLATQKISVEVDDDAKLLLVEQGYDPRLGARPMRRVVQRVIENNVAKAMLAGMVLPGSIVKITRSQVEASTNARAEADSIAKSSE